MLCADKFPVSSSSSLSSSSKFVTTIFTKPLFGHFPPLNPRWVSPPLTCFPSKTPPLPTTLSSFTNKNKNNTLSSIIKSLRLSNDLEQTLDSLFVENHNIMTSSTKITVIIRKQRNWERIVRVFKWFKYQEGYVHNVIHYNVVLRALGRAHKWDILRLCWIDMAKNNVLPTNITYSTLVDCYAKAGHAKEALLWIKDMRMRGFFIDEVTMSTVIKVLKDIGEFDRADRFYKNWCSGKVDLDDLDFNSSSSLVPIGFKTGELFNIDGGIRDSNAMSSMYMENVGPQKPQDPTTYNTLIDLYGKAGRLNDVAGVFDDMMKSGVAVDTCTFNTMIYIYGSYGNLLEVESLLLKMAEKGVSPNTATYNILLSLYANAGNIDAALSCYRMIREDGLFPDSITYRALLGVLCTGNMVQAVEDVIEDMKKSSVSLGEHSLECIVKMYVNEGDHDKANELILRPPLPTTPSSFTNKNNTLSSIIMSLRLSNDLEQTLDSLFVENHYIMTSSTKITVIIREQRNWERIVRVFKWFEYQEGYVHNVIHYNVVLRALGRAHKWDMLRLCWIDMAKNNVLPTNTTYSTLVDCYAKAGRAKEALLWIKDMRMRGFFIDEVTMSTVIKVLKDIGEFDRADRFYKNWCSGKVDLDDLDFDSSSSLVPIGFKTGELFKIDGGIRDSNAMASMYMENVGPQKPQDPTTYNTLIDLYGKAGRLNDVAGVFDDMMKSGVAVDTCTFNTMIYIYGSHGNLLEVESLLLKMAEKGVSPNTPTYNVLLSLYANAGNIDAALSCYRMIREDGLFPDGVTYRALLGVLCTGNMVEAVEDVIKDMKKSSVSLGEHSLECIVKMYVNEGDHDKANDLVQKFTTNRGKYVRNNVN